MISIRKCIAILNHSVIAAIVKLLHYGLRKSASGDQHSYTHTRMF